GSDSRIERNSRMFTSKRSGSSLRLVSSRNTARRANGLAALVWGGGRGRGEAEIGPFSPPPPPTGCPRGRRGPHGKNNTAAGPFPLPGAREVELAGRLFLFGPFGPKDGVVRLGLAGLEGELQLGQLAVGQAKAVLHAVPGRRQQFLVGDEHPVVSPRRDGK